MSLVLSRIQNIRAIAPLDKNNLKPSRYGAFDLFLRQTQNANSIVTPELKEKAFASIGSTVQVPKIDYDSSVSISNTRSLTIADDEGTSSMYDVSWTTYSWGFTMTPSLYLNNEISYQRDFENKFMKYLYAVLSSLDSAAITALGTGKTSSLTNPLTYTFSSSYLNVLNGAFTRFIGDLEPLMASNDYYSPIDVVGDVGLQSELLNIAQFGTYNQMNRALQFSGKNFMFSNRITNALEDPAFAGFAVAENSVGLLTRLERSCLLFEKTSDGHEWGRAFIAPLGFDIGTYYYEAAVDGSSLAGAASADMTRVKKEFYGFSFDFALISALAGDGKNPILAFQGSTGTGA